MNEDLQKQIDEARLAVAAAKHKLFLLTQQRDEEAAKKEAATYLGKCYKVQSHDSTETQIHRVIGYKDHLLRVISLEVTSRGVDVMIENIICPPEEGYHLISEAEFFAGVETVIAKIKELVQL